MVEVEPPDMEQTEEEEQAEESEESEGSEGSEVEYRGLPRPIGDACPSCKVRPRCTRAVYLPQMTAFPCKWYCRPSIGAVRRTLLCCACCGRHAHDMRRGCLT